MYSVLIIFRIEILNFKIFILYSILYVKPVQLLLKPTLFFILRQDTTVQSTNIFKYWTFLTLILFYLVSFYTTYLRGVMHYVKFLNWDHSS